MKKVKKIKVIKEVKPKNELRGLIEKGIYLLQGELKIDEGRLRYLRSYTQALVQVPLEAVDEKFMEVKELALVFVCAAQFVLLSRPSSKNFKPKSREKLALQLLEADDAID